MLTMGQPGRWILIFLMAAAAGTGGYWLAHRGAEPVEATATAAVQPPVVPPATVIPERRPDVTLADRDGEPRNLAEWNGKPQVINFWATWCAPCRREIPMLNALSGDGHWPGIALIGVAIDFREDVLRYLETTPINYTVLIGEQDGRSLPSWTRQAGSSPSMSASCTGPRRTSSSRSCTRSMPARSI
jgi:hypothetical protein